MKLAFVFASSESYMPRTQVAAESFRTFHPEIAHCLLPLPDVQETYVEGSAKVRLQAARELLEDAFDGIIVIGSDCVLYDTLELFISHMHNASIVLTPHMLTPPQDAAYFYRTGHANGDLIGFTRRAIPILDWLISQPMVNNVPMGMFYEQTLLSAIPFFYRDVAIAFEGTFNYAYYNFHERPLVIRDNRYFIPGHGNLAMAQFSGWEEGQLPKASKHSAIQIENPATLQLFQEYEANVARQKAIISGLL